MNNLKQKRELAGLTQSQLAKKAEISKRTIQSYEQGLKDINKAAGMTLYKIAGVLNCRIEDLFEK